MGDISNNFNRSEFCCNCCNFDTVDVELVAVLEGARAYFTMIEEQEVYIDITGPNRCIKHNKAEGGAAESQHIYGRAADHKIIIKSSGKHVSPVDVYDYYDNFYKDKYGVGLYTNRVHIDTRSGNAARWDMT